MDIDLYAMKSPVIREMYLMELKKLLDFLDLQEAGILEEKATIFAGREGISGFKIYWHNKIWYIIDVIWLSTSF